MVLLPVCGILVAVLGFIISLVQFMIYDGYQTELNSLTNFDFESAFSKQTLSFDASVICDYIFQGLLLVAVIVMLILFYKTATEKKKIFVSASLAFAAITIISVELFLAINYRRITLSKGMEEQFIRFFSSFTPETIYYCKIGFMVLCIAAATIVGFLLFTTKNIRPAMRYIIIALIAQKLVLPLLLFVIEHIFSIVAFIIFAIIFILVGKVFLSFSEIDSSYDEEFEEYNRAAVRKNTKKGNRNRKEYHVPDGIELVKVKGLTCDYVERYNSIGGSSRVCTLYELRSGEFKIYDKYGRRIGEHDLLWRK